MATEQASSGEELRDAVLFHARFEYQAQTFRIAGSNELWSGDVFNLPKGVEPVMPVRRRWEYWRAVLPTHWTDAQVDQYQFKHWCGGFTLFCLHAAGLAAGVHWRDGLGYVEPQRLPRVTVPRPGDIAYYERNSHYALVERVRGNVFDSIDGNQGKTLGEPSINCYTGRALIAPKFFYSIQPFIDQALGVTK